MRIGNNPMKSTTMNKREGYHRVIIPVHIPHQNDYYAESYEILKLCLSSLLQTVHNQTLITIINNNSCKEVTEYLINLLKESKIDQLILFTENQGKIDPIVSVMRGCLEDLITVSDCDVLFKMGWQNETEKVFEQLPKTGMVSPLPQPQFRYLYTTWAWYSGLKENKIARIENQDKESLQIFKKSIGRNDDLSEIENYPFYIVKNNLPVACIGSGHFCATYSKKVLPYIPNKSSGNKFINAEEPFLDEPVELAGLMRLSTMKGMVFHMGNKVESWMYETNNNQINFTENIKQITLADGYFHKFKGFRVMVKYILSSTRVRNYISKKLSKKVSMK